jgi:iron complex outermembrane receptor protein
MPPFAIRPMIRWRLLLCLALLAVPPAGRAEEYLDVPLEQLTRTGLSGFSPNAEITTAAKYAQSRSESPATVRVATAEDIKTYGYRTLAEILRSMPGLYISNDRNYSYLGVRGFSPPGDYNSRVLLLVDGIRFNDNLYDGLYIGNEFPIDVDLIERVEFVPGPGSALYGNNALFGVVNVITKRGQALDCAHLVPDYGGFDTYKVRGSYGRRFDSGAELLLSATGFDREGPDQLYYREFDTPAQNGGHAVGMDYERAHSAFGKFSFAGLTLEGAYNSRLKGVPTASYGQAFGDPRSDTLDERTFVAMTYDGHPAPNWDFWAKVDYHRYDYLGHYVFASPPQPLDLDSALGEWWGGELRLVSSAWNDHRLSLGVEWQDNLRQWQANRNAGGPVYLDARQDGFRYGLFAEDAYRVTDELTVSAGARFDHGSFGYDAANPRFGLVWRARQDTTVKLNYGTAYRAPNAFELYYADSAGRSGYLPPGRLSGERVQTAELGLEHALSPTTRLELTAYHNSIAHLISQTLAPDGFYRYRNQGETRAVGVETAVDQRFAGGLRARLSHTWQQTDDSHGRTLDNAPRHMAKLNLSSPLWNDDWTLGFDTLYMDSRKVRGSLVDGHVLGSLTLNGRVAANLDVSASAYNLWNARYADPTGAEFLQNGILQDGRGFRIRLDWRF